MFTKSSICLNISAGFSFLSNFCFSRQLAVAFKDNGLNSLSLSLLNLELSDMELK